MAWKIERWLSEVFPGEENIYSEYRLLPPRELVIVCAAVLDAALTELLFMRFEPKGKEAEQFLGINGDGRAPAGSFGARIQLALLTGILTERDVVVLRKIKTLRNLFAHQVNISFSSPQIVKLNIELCDAWVEQLKYIYENRLGDSLPAASLVNIQVLKEVIPTVPQAGEGMVLAMLSQYQTYFHRLHGMIKPIGLAI